MSKVDFKLNLAGLNALMKSPEMQTLLQQQGDLIRNEAENMSDGGKFEAETKPLNWTTVTTVRVKDNKALRANLRDNVLMKSLNAGKF